MHCSNTKLTLACELTPVYQTNICRNVLLEDGGGPTCIGPADSNVCLPDVGYCDAPFLFHTKEKALEIRDSYWHMAHFSRYIPRDSVRVLTGPHTGGLNVTAVVTPAHELVVVVLNTLEQAIPYQVQIGSSFYAASIPAAAIQTLTASLDP
eukprot:m.140445 g.140445  ORF g.140445 m.140445 type:complete len:151 (-) comp20336_c0_seq1:37-489(-)